MFNWLSRLLFGPSHAEREAERLKRDWEAEYQENLRKRELQDRFPAYTTNGFLPPVRVSVANPNSIAYTEEERLARIRRMEEDAHRRRTDETRNADGDASMFTTGVVAAAIIGASHYVDSTPSHSSSHDSGSCSSHDSGSSSGGDSGGSCGGGE